jgi:Sigma-70, region 4
MGMPGERLSMRKIREVLRLRFAQGLSQRAIGISLRLSTGAVNTYLNRARRAGLDWPLPDGLDDVQLETLLYPPPPAVAVSTITLFDGGLIATSDGLPASGSRAL